MFSANKKILWLCALLLFIGGILVWRIWIYQAEVNIEANVPFTLRLRQLDEINGETYACPNQNCTYRLRPGTYELTMEAPGYLTQNQEYQVRWLQDNDLRLQLQKIPTLAPLAQAPESWQQELDRKNEHETRFGFNASGELVQKTGAQENFIAAFPPVESENARIIPGTSERIFVFTPQKLYAVEVAERRKYQVYAAESGTEITAVRALSTDRVLMLLQQGEVTKTLSFFISNRTATEFPEALPSLDLLCLNPEKQAELFFLTAQNSSWLVKKLDLNSQEVTGIAGYAFEAAPENLLCETAKTILIRTADEKFFRLNWE